MISGYPEGLAVPAPLKKTINVFGEQKCKEKKINLSKFLLGIKLKSNSEFFYFSSFT